MQTNNTVGFPAPVHRHTFTQRSRNVSRSITVLICSATAAVVVKTCGKIKGEQMVEIERISACSGLACERVEAKPPSGVRVRVRLRRPFPSRQPGPTLGGKSPVRGRRAAVVAAAANKLRRKSPAGSPAARRSSGGGEWLAGGQMSADDAHRLFQGTRGPDLSALPDEMLQHILSFLPAQEAVQTCVLARRWRHLWRSTTGLRLVSRDGPGPARDLRKFVGNLLRRHDKRTDLHTIEIKIKFDAYSDGDNLPYVVLWIRSAVRRRVRSLTLHHFGPFLDLDTSQQLGPSLYLDGAHLDSPHLTTLDLASVEVEYTLLDFASCPALEYLKLHECYISLSKIYSASLKHLSITGCFYDPPCRLHVSTPGLVSLRLDNFWGVTPFFENMVQLETAWVNLGRHCQDTCCSYLQYGIYCGADNACLSCDDYSAELVLLGGISSARHLELISEFQNITFSRDLEHCPVFRNLKTLLLNEYWCMPPAGCDRLACILKNSPVLDKLTLELFSQGPDHEVEMKGNYGTMEGPSAISEHLKIVQVKCNAVDEKILEVLKFLCALNIRFDVE